MPQCFHLLLVEDNPADAELVAEILRESDGGAQVELHTVTDGVQALEFIRRQGAFTEVPRPDLVLLDLNLPRLGGREVLEAIKGDAETAMIPVIVLSSSQAPNDVLEVYGLHASAYLRKPMDLEGMDLLINEVCRFWFEAAQLPTRPS